MEQKNRFISPPRDQLNKLRQPLTPGEWKVFKLFDRYLDPEWEIYVQPHLNGLRPDFVLLHPRVGIAVFEVKDWNLNAMNYCVKQDGDRPPVLMAEKDGKSFSIESENPIRKIHIYKNEIFNLYCPRLKQGSGYAAITAGVIFPFAMQTQVINLLQPCLEHRKMDKAISYNPISGYEAIRDGDISMVFPESARRYSHQMHGDLVKDFRNWLIEPDFSATQRQPIELDKNQRYFVTSRTDSGYRRIRGAAGSGKSLILAARAAELLGQGKTVLVVTYNITLIHYLMDVAVRWPSSAGKTRSDITWLNFHHWCKRTCQTYGAESQYENLLRDPNLEYVLSEALPALVSTVLDQSNVQPEYDAVLVDEGQDFRLAWWEALRKVCKPGGEMLLVADVTQDIYGTASAWTDEAMIGAGFSGKWAELSLSYRMPKVALDKAVEFAKKYLPEAARIIPASDQGDLALEPCELRWVQSTPENSAAVCRDEIIRLFSTDDHQDYSFADTTFLCDIRLLGLEVVKRLGQQGIRCVHTYDPDNAESRRQKVGFYMGDARVKATTLHSFKGWESRSLVIYIGEKINSQSMALLYTGLTRIKRHMAGSCLTVISSSVELSEYGKTWPDFEAIF
nr:UvrD-helicase domain-containing protein [uncultured Pseudomonas sp.]